MITPNHHPSHSLGQRNPGMIMGPIILVIVLNSAMATLYNAPISFDQIKDMFDRNGCLTGSLTVVPVVLGKVSDETSGGGGSSVETGQDESSPTGGAAGDPSSAHQALLGKEKTPMCLVNELARFNKIEHQYRLTSEDGPPHKKKFTVTLKLGDEEYTAEGASIKKAQHAAAALALQSTVYKHPPPKSTRQSRGAKMELNALAMKRGEPTVYTLVESPQYHHNYGFSHRQMYTQGYNEQFSFPFARGKPQYRSNFNRAEPGGMSYNQQRYYGKPGGLYKVVVKVGEREFTGEGNSAQAARHDAASKALHILHSLPLDETCPASCPLSNTTTTISPQGGLSESADSELKSPISLVHEVALKRNLPVVFEVISEKGQPHMKTFVTRCTVGDKFQTTGEGNGKKISKKRAAEKMLEQLNALPPTTTVTASGCATSMSRMKRKTNPGKKKTRNIIKETPVTQVKDSSGGQNKYDSGANYDEMNPISRLIQIQQAKKEREPVYTLREERGLPRRKEFVMEVSVGKHSYIGSGPNKKVAKRNAAEGLLQQMGYSSPTLNRTGHPLSGSGGGAGTQSASGAGPTSGGGTNTHSTTSKSGNKVRFSDEKPSVGGVAGRQLVPGLLLMNDKTTNNGHKSNPGLNLKTTATIAKEYLNEGSSPTADALAGHNRPKGGAVRPTEQLLYLASVLNFQVQFSDFPKGNHTEYLSLVSLATDPPQVCHGAGATTELSHDQAALNALRSLSEMGLDSIAPGKMESAPSLTTGPDGLYIPLTIPKEEPYVNGK